MNFDELKQQCLVCQRCGLCETRTHVVFGQGVPDAEVLLWAKAPAPTRTHKACRLWAAAASCWTITWKRLTLTAAKNIYIANIVKCRPPENRDPAPEESAACLPWLRMQFRLLRPKNCGVLGPHCRPADDWERLFRHAGPR